MLRNPTYHRRRTERQRREEARRGIAAEQMRIAAHLGEQLGRALGAHLDARGAGADASLLLTVPGGTQAH